MTFLEILKGLLSDCYQKSHAKWQKEQQEMLLAQNQIQQQQLRNSLIIKSQQLTCELAECFHGKDYPYLKPDISANNLRFQRCAFIHGHWVFDYTLRKSVNSAILKDDLEHIKRQMNRDIELTQWELCQYLGLDSFTELHNLLYNGICIWEARDSKWDVTIRVATETGAFQI